MKASVTLENRVTENWKIILTNALRELLASS